MFFEFKKGFTIVEMLIYMGLLSILLVVMGQLFFGTLDTQLSSQINNAIDQDYQFLLTKLSYQISQADQVILPSNLGDQSNNLLLVENGINYNYYLSDQALWVNDGTSDFRLSNSEVFVTRFQATKVGNPSGKSAVELEIDLETAGTSMGDHREIRNISKIIGLR